MGKVKIKTDVVREHLTSRNISQNNLALQAAVSQGYLSQVLHWQRSPGPAVRQRLMAALRIKNFYDLFEVMPENGRAEESG